MSILIKTLLERVIEEFSKPNVIWDNSELSKNDLKFLYNECNTESEFDPTNKRKMMYDGMMDGNLYVMAAKCEYGQVLAVFETMEQMAEMPWDLWGRIFRMFYEPWRKPFKVFFLAHRSLRLFPADNEPIEAENINGGYTYRCNPETIVIYRAEDATRVLIHELQHSCCLDKEGVDLDTKESETEAWAELFYIAILSQGKKYIFNDMLKRQSEWMRKQNAKVKKHMKDPNSKEFPWRYTIGKEDIWRRWGILSDENLSPPIRVVDSLRLTYPPDNVLKDRFKVNRSSVIL
jgi:hypothetical protein